MNKTVDLVEALFPSHIGDFNNAQWEALLEKKISVGGLPIQPLFLGLKSLPLDDRGRYLELFSPKQRQVMQDIDLWGKDSLEPESFLPWVKTYASCPNDEIRLEFIKGVEFQLFLKSRFNIWTFDAEDPLYPEHDRYFLTDDNLLLFEYDETFPYADEVQNLVRELYGDMGVEKAYAYLFKMMTDSYLEWEEEEYRFKNHRMRDFGLVNYLEALENTRSLPSKEFLKVEMKKAKRKTGEIDTLGKVQGPSPKAMIPFKEEGNPFFQELLKVKDEKRLEFIRFNFIMLLNSGFEIDDSLKKGNMAITREAKKTQFFLSLGLDFLKREYPLIDESFDPQDSLLTFFDCCDIFRFGRTLVESNLKTLKDSLKGTPFDEEKEEFLGSLLGEFLDQSFELPIKVKNSFKDGSGSEREISIVADLEIWEKQVQTFSNLIPYISKFFEVHKKLEKSGTLQDSFYLNYAVNEIDFEAILVSSFFNFVLGLFEKEGDNKLGVSPEEYRNIMKVLVGLDGELKLNQKLDQKIHKFSELFNFSQIEGFKDYLLGVLISHLDGIKVHELLDNELKHVGGAIILNTLKNNVVQ